MNKRIIFIIVAVILVAVTLPAYLTVGGLSLMAFDQGFSWRPALFALGIIGTCILVPIFSLIYAITFIRKEKPWHGLGVSLIPALVFGVFWVWLSQQSFT